MARTAATAIMPGDWSRDSENAKFASQSNNHQLLTNMYYIRKNHPKNVLRMLFISPHYRATRSGKSAEKSVPEPARRAVSAREIHPLRPNRPEGLRASGRRTVELEELRRRGEEAVAGAACADEGALSFNTTMCHSYRDSPYKR